MSRYNYRSMYMNPMVTQVKKSEIDTPNTKRSISLEKIIIQITREEGKRNRNEQRTIKATGK